MKENTVQGNVWDYLIWVKESIISNVVFVKNKFIQVITELDFVIGNVIMHGRKPIQILGCSKVEKIKSKKIDIIITYICGLEKINQNQNYVKNVIKSIRKNAIILINNILKIWKLGNGYVVNVILKFIKGDLSGS